MAASSSCAHALIVISFLFIASAASLAQAPAPPGSGSGNADSPHQPGVTPTSDARASQNQSDREKAAEQIKKQEKQRVLGILPQFNVSEISNAVKLSPKQKFELGFKTAIDPGTVLFSAVSAGISQAENSFPGYGQGAEGYAKRLGASYVDSFDGTIIGNAALPALLHQDPRYFRKGTGHFVTRAGYAVFSTFRCKSDSGNWQPNYSNILGNFAAGAISNVYYPEGERGLVSTYQRAIVVSGEGAIGALISEFWPDIAHHFRKGRSIPASSTTSVSPTTPASPTVPIPPK